MNGNNDASRFDAKQYFRKIELIALTSFNFIKKEYSDLQLPIEKKSIISETDTKTRVKLLKIIECLDYHDIYAKLNDDNSNSNSNNDNSNDNNSIIDRSTLNEALKKLELQIELEETIWKWKTSHNFIGFDAKTEKKNQRRFL